jgi:DNA-binding NtrC family response regulator
LENTIERAALIGNGPKLMPEHLILDSVAAENQSSPVLAMKAGVTVREMEKQLINKTLEEVDDNRTRAAELLGISIRTLRNKLREYREEHERSPAKAAQPSG